MGRDDGEGGRMEGFIYLHAFSACGRLYEGKKIISYLNVFKFNREVNSKVNAKKEDSVLSSIQGIVDSF